MSVKKVNNKLRIICDMCGQDLGLSNPKAYGKSHACEGKCEETYEQEIRTRPRFVQYERGTTVRSQKS